VVLSWKWAEKGGGRQRRTQVEIFSAAVLISDDVESDAISARRSKFDVLWCNPAKDSSRPFCALDFPFAAGAGSLGGLCCSCTEQIWVPGRWWSGVWGEQAGGACEVLVLAWQPTKGTVCLCS
jgi:hypothetical protein